MRKLPWLQRLHSDGRATFQDGHSVQPDCIIYSTGYKYTYPWLQKTGLLSTGERLYGQLVSHRLETANKFGLQCVCPCAYGDRPALHW